MTVELTPMPTLAERFQMLVPAFEAGPAPLYAHLSVCAAAELERPGPFRDALEPFADEPPRRLLPLRLLATVHRWVLAGALPDLALHYPSAGGTWSPRGAWPLFRDTVIERAAELPALLAPPLQHNEVTRAAAVGAGLLVAARERRMPLALLEVGASAGLLLRWDHYRDRWWFPSMFDALPPLDGRPAVMERRGCDLSPIDPATDEGSLRLRSFVWADLAEHVRILEEAIEICRRVPARVDRADGADWLEEQLVEPRPGVVTVVMHSLMRASGPPESLARIEQAVARAAAAATREAPFAHLRFEAPDDTHGAPPGRARTLVETRLTVWPGGENRLLATSDVNGRHVRWLG